SRGAVSRAHARLSEIQPDQLFAGRKEQRRDGRTDPNISPLDMCIRDELVQEREQNRDSSERNEVCAQMEDGLRRGQEPLQKLASGRYGGAQEQPEQPQKPDSQAQGQRQESPPDPGP